MATAAASGGGPFQVDVTSEEAYKEVLKASHAALQGGPSALLPLKLIANGLLLPSLDHTNNPLSWLHPICPAVVELYQQWCGPTKAVITTFKRFLLDNPAADVKFYTVCVNKVPALSRFEGKSEPAFIFIKVRPRSGCTCTPPRNCSPKFYRAPPTKVCELTKGTPQQDRPQHLTLAAAGLCSSPQDGKVLEEVVGVQLPKLTRLMQTLSAAGGSAAVVHSSSTEE